MSLTIRTQLAQECFFLEYDGLLWGWKFFRNTLPDTELDSHYTLISLVNNISYTLDGRDQHYLYYGANLRDQVIRFSYAIYSYQTDCDQKRVQYRETMKDISQLGEQVWAWGTKKNIRHFLAPVGFYPHSIILCCEQEVLVNEFVIPRSPHVRKEIVQRAVEQEIRAQQTIVS